MSYEGIDGDLDIIHEALRRRRDVRDCHSCGKEYDSEGEFIFGTHCPRCVAKGLNPEYLITYSLVDESRLDKMRTKIVFDIRAWVDKNRSNFYIYLIEKL